MNKKDGAASVNSSISTTDEEWTAFLALPGLRISHCVAIDPKAKWAGPCDSMQGVFKRFKTEFTDSISFSQAQADTIEALVDFRNKSCPTFLFFFNNILVKIVKGANAPLLEKTIREQLQIEKDGGVHVPLSLDGGNSFFFSEESKVKQTGDDVYLEGPFQKTLAIIKPDAMSPSAIEHILEVIKKNRFQVLEKKKIWMSKELVAQFYKEHEGQPFFGSLQTYLSAAPVLALVLAKDNCIAAWRSHMGPPNSKRAREEAPKSIRAVLGTDSRLNAIFGSATEAAAETEIELLFGAESNAFVMPFAEEELSTATTGPQKTTVIIKPDIVQAGKVDEIIEKILCRGYQIAAREEMQLTSETASDLYANLKEDPNHGEMVSFITSGPVLALVIKGEDVVRGWNEMIGDADPEVAKVKGPSSIRALYGKDLIHNAVHGSDSIDNAIREIHLLFPRVLKKGSRASFLTRPPSQINVSSEGGADAADVTKLLDALANEQRTLALIKPDAYGAGKKADIVAKITEAGFKIIHEKEIQLTIEKSCEFYKEHQGKPFYEELTTWMSSAPIYALVLEKKNAVYDWRDLAGPTNSENARETAPNSIRALFGTDGSKNAVHGSDSIVAAEREITLLFGDQAARLSPFISLPGSKVVSRAGSSEALAAARDSVV